MLISGFYYELLGLTPGASTGEVKKAYRSLVRKNHPDLFPPEQKEFQELKMVQINEAYTRIIDGLRVEGDEKSEARAGREGAGTVGGDGIDQDDDIGRGPAPGMGPTLDRGADLEQENGLGRFDTGQIGTTQVGFHRDLEYAYYKQGFENFSKALYGIKRIEKRSGPRNDLYYLKRFSSSLAFLRKADTYFSNLLELSPDSMWAYDARAKKRRIEYFNRLYRKIVQNIESRLKERKKTAG